MARENQPSLRLCFETPLGSWITLTPTLSPRGFRRFAPEDASFDAGRVMLGRLDELAAENEDFAFEITLASRSYARRLRELQEKGYLIFLWLRDVEYAIERVKTRVKLGGHDIAEETIRRRFERGRKNFFELYVSIANAWRVFDAAPKKPKEIARYTDVGGETVFENEIWKLIKK